MTLDATCRNLSAGDTLLGNIVSMLIVGGAQRSTLDKSTLCTDRQCRGGIDDGMSCVKR